MPSATRWASAGPSTSALDPRRNLPGTHQGFPRLVGDAPPAMPRTSPGPARARWSCRRGTALGVRERVNQFFTWEVDLRYIQGRGLELPTQPYLATAGGDVLAPTLEDRYQNGFGFSAMGEFTWSKRWTARVGIEILPALVKGSTSSPTLGGAQVRRPLCRCGLQGAGRRVQPRLPVPPDHVRGLHGHRRGLGRRAATSPPGTRSAARPPAISWRSATRGPSDVRFLGPHACEEALERGELHTLRIAPPAWERCAKLRAAARERGVVVHREPMDSLDRRAQGQRHQGRPGRGRGPRLQHPGRPGGAAPGSRAKPPWCSPSTA